MEKKKDFRSISEITSFSSGHRIEYRIRTMNKARMSPGCLIWPHYSTALNPDGNTDFQNSKIISKFETQKA